MSGAIFSFEDMRGHVWYARELFNSIFAVYSALSARESPHPKERNHSMLSAIIVQMNKG